MLASYCSYLAFSYQSSWELTAVCRHLPLADYWTVEWKREGLLKSYTVHATGGGQETLQLLEKQSGLYHARKYTANTLNVIQQNILVALPIKVCEKSFSTIPINNVFCFVFK